MMERLLQAGADPNQFNPYGETPLHAAVSSGEVRAVELLLRHGADPGLANPEGQTPLSLAIEEGKPEIRQLLERETGHSLER